jgi:type IV pilus assembly protein PilA
MPRSRHSEQGFTLIELLVVVAIIGILAAIALPAFLGQRSGASDAKAKSDLSNAHHALETYWAQNDTYAATQAELIALEPAVSNALNLTITGTGDSFRLTTDAHRGATFIVEKTGAVIDRTCTPAGTGGCDDDGTW